MRKTTGQMKGSLIFHFTVTVESNQHSFLIQLGVPTTVKNLVKGYDQCEKAVICGIVNVSNTRHYKATKICESSSNLQNMFTWMEL